jgi:hypothetical protein
MGGRLESIGRHWALGLNEQEQRFCVAVLGFNLILALGIIILKLATGMNLRVLLQDVTVVADLPPYAGAYQFVSILFYAAAAAVALFAVAAQPADPVRGLLGLGGGYAAFACLDDLFTLHENGLFIGLPERGVMALHAGLLVWLLAQALRLRARTPWPVLAGALVVMTMAFAIDAPGLHFAGEATAEEMLETVGATLLAAYLILTAYRRVAPRLAAGPASRS